MRHFRTSEILSASSTMSICVAVVLLTLSCCCIDCGVAQATRDASVAPPGDSPVSAGPLAHNLRSDFRRRDIAKAIRLVADWQLNRLPAKAQTNWTWAVLYSGFMAVPPQVSGNKYSAAMLSVADALDWQPGPRVLHADDEAVGQTYLALYLIHGDQKMIAPIRERIDEVMRAPDNPATPLWWWSDALYMAPPVFAALGRLSGDNEYFAYMDHEWWRSTELLYDPVEHLYSRDSTFLDKREKNGKRVFWARGNGWVMAGIVRVLQELPADSPLRAKYVNLLREMASATLKVQGIDGLWRPGLLDPDTYPLPEISGSALITYAIAYGVNEGILDRSIYTPALHKAWKGMLEHVYADGRLGCIQPIGRAPGPFIETSSYAYGVGAYLLASSEIFRMGK